MSSLPSSELKKKSVKKGINGGISTMGSIPISHNHENPLESCSISTPLLPIVEVPSERSLSLGGSIRTPTQHNLHLIKTNCLSDFKIDGCSHLVAVRRKK